MAKSPDLALGFMGQLLAQGFMSKAGNCKFTACQSAKDGDILLSEEIEAFVRMLLFLLEFRNFDACVKTQLLLAANAAK